MYLKKLQLKNFRNYEYLDIDFNKKVNILIGNNAQGKTNLVEGIYMMGLGKSFRTAKDREIIKFNEDESYINGIFKKEDTDLEIKISIQNKKNQILRSIKIDDTEYKKTSSLLENVYVVVFSPEDLRMIKDAPELRRKFIDKELCQIRPVYYKNLSLYKKVVFYRNKYLKENNKIDLDYLYSLNHTLALYGSYIILERESFIKKLNGYVKKIHNDITDGAEKIYIEYESNIKILNDKKSQYDEIIRVLEENQERDIRRRITNKGPHKDDLIVKINGIDARNYGSQGQQRTAALSLKLAETHIIKDEVSENPILILDDVLSELDKKRQQFLINSITENQVFITSADIGNDVIDSIKEKSIYKIEQGKILKINW